MSQTIYGTEGGDRIRGGRGNDIIFGEAGDDELFATFGNDIVYGGIGDDRIDVVFGSHYVDAGSGDDLVVAYCNVDFSNLSYYAGLPPDGADTLIGGEGFDTLAFFNSTEPQSHVIVDLEQHTVTGVTTNSIFGFEVILGTRGNDKLYGSNDNENLFANAGDDVLRGRGGADTLDGHVGNDIYQYVSASDSGPTAATRDVIFGFETGYDKIDLSEMDASVLESGRQTFVFIGNSAFHHRVGELSVRVEAATAAEIEVIPSLPFNTIVEADLNGDGLADFSINLRGTVPLTEADFILPASPPPAIKGERFHGTRGDDRIAGTDGDDTLRGGRGDDRLDGRAGDDTLTGGMGRDVLRGGAGHDVFDFNSAKEMKTGDWIAGFTHGVDRIDLSMIDANGLGPGHAFTFLTREDHAFTGKAGELRWSQVNAAGSAHDRTVIKGDINGDGRADFHINLRGLIALTTADFIL